MRYKFELEFIKLSHGDNWFIMCRARNILKQGFINLFISGNNYIDNGFGIDAIIPWHT